MRAKDQTNEEGRPTPRQGSTATPETEVPVDSVPDTVRFVLGDRYHIESRDYGPGTVVTLDLIDDASGSFYALLKASCGVPPATGLCESANALDTLINDIRASHVSLDDHRYWAILIARCVAIQYQVVNPNSIPVGWESEIRAIEKLLIVSIKKFLTLLEQGSKQGMCPYFCEKVNDIIAPFAIAASRLHRVGETADRFIIRECLKIKEQSITWHPLSFGPISSTHNEPEVLSAIAFAVSDEGLALDANTIEIGSRGDAVVALRGIAL
jgi:hypothetical protein